MQKTGHLPGGTKLRSSEAWKSLKNKKSENSSRPNIIKQHKYKSILPERGC